MYPFLKIFLIVLLALALIDWLADRDRRADTSIPNAKPGWALLSGDISEISKVWLYHCGLMALRAASEIVRHYCAVGWR